jgi:hypothetical protein
MKRMLTFATILSSISLFTSAFAQEELAFNKSAENSIQAQQSISPGGSYIHSFQAVIFPRLNGSVSVNVQKGRYETITVHIYNIDGQLLTQDKLSKYNLIAKEYQGLPKGIYTFKIASYGKVYSKEIVIN